MGSKSVLLSDEHEMPSSICTFSVAPQVHDIFAKPARALQHIRGDFNASVLGIQEVVHLLEEQFAPALTNCPKTATSDVLPAL
jgi:hypothetical protein